MADQPKGLTVEELMKLLGVNEATARQLAEISKGDWVGDVWEEAPDGTLRPLHHGPNWKPEKEESE